MQREPFPAPVKHLKYGRAAGIRLYTIRHLEVLCSGLFLHSLHEIVGGIYRGMRRRYDARANSLLEDS
jgi:hypothetical protein